MKSFRNKTAFRIPLILFLAFAGVSALFLFWRQPSEFIILNIRLPRIYLALVTGMVLGGVGSTYQLIFSNPLAEPYILGVSSGAALGSIVASVLGLYILAPLLSFAGALITIIIVWSLAHIDGVFDKNKLLLSGIITAMFFSAVISLLMYLNQREIGSIINTLMGNIGFIFSRSEWRVFLSLSVGVFLLLTVLFLMSNKLNILATGDLSAAGLGVDAVSLRKKVFLTGSILTGIVVAYSGIIGFVGLIVPHIIRSIVGSDQRKVFVYSLMGGGCFLIFCDFLAMHLTVIEIPIGVITAFFGCPFFIYFMLKKQK